MTIGRSYGRVLKQTVLIMMTMLFGVSVFGCAKNNPAQTDTTVVPASPEECMTEENMVFYYSEEVVATVDGNGYTEYKIYKYTNSEVILFKRSKEPGEESKADYRIVPSSVLDDCMKQVKKYKMGKGKWLDGDGIVGKVFETGFIQDGEYIQVSSSHMPDNGTKAFDSIEKILSKAWSS